MHLKFKRADILPDSELGVVNDVIRHGELGIVLWRVNGLGIPNNASL